MKLFKYLFLTIFVYLLSGCSSKYPVTFNSNPTGASVVCNGTNWGYAPITLYYDEKVKEYNSLDISSCSANWVSGYSQKYGSAPVRQYPNGVMQTLNRPFGDGYEKDAQFALQVENSKYLKKQARAAQDAADAQERQANQQLYDSLKPKTYNVTPNYMGGYNVIQY